MFLLHNSGRLNKYKTAYPTRSVVRGVATAVAGTAITAGHTAAVQCNIRVKIPGPLSSTTKIYARVIHKVPFK